MAVIPFSNLFAKRVCSYEGIHYEYICDQIENKDQKIKCHEEWVFDENCVLSFGHKTLILID